MAREKHSPARLDNAPLDYEPQEEQGVVFLFSTLARKRYGLRVQKVQKGYPDCIASKSGKEIRIEFEYKASNFKQHGHDPKECDWIVCWINDWPDHPKRLRIVELRKDYGLGFNVWILPVAGEYREAISNVIKTTWTVPQKSSKGDLLLYYRTTPDCCIQDIFRISSYIGLRKYNKKERNRAVSKTDWMASIRRVCSLKTSLKLKSMKSDSILRDAGFVRGKMRGRYRVSDYWPELYEMILKRNPSIKRTLSDYSPAKLA